MKTISTMSSLSESDSDTSSGDEEFEHACNRVRLVYKGETGERGILTG